MKIKINKEGSPIDLIETYVPLYLPTYERAGTISIIAKKESQFPGRPAGLFYATFNQAKSNINSFCHKNNINRYHNSSMYTIVYISSVERFRDVANFLYSNNYIDASDRANIEDEIRRVEAVVTNRTKISETDYTVAQQDALIDIVKPYLDAIVDVIQDATDVIPFLFFATQRLLYQEAEEKRGLERLLSEKLTPDLVPEIRDCVVQLNKIIVGLEDLSSTFLRVGNTIPSLGLQKQIIMKEVQKIIEEKFASELNEYQRFYLQRSLIRLSTQEFHHLDGKISNQYIIDSLSGFPRAVVIPLTTASDSFFHDSDSGVTITEEERHLLNQFGLTRFPVSEADFALAKKDSSEADNSVPVVTTTPNRTSSK